MGIYPESFVAEVNNAVDIRRMLDLIDYRLDKLKDSGEIIRGLCPIHRESVFPTLLIDKTRRTFRCTYSLCPGTKGGNLVELFALARNVDTDEAVKELVRELGIRSRLPADPEFAAKTAELAENYLTLGAFAEAEQTFQEILLAQPDHEPSHEGLLRVYTQINDAAGQAREREALARICLGQNKLDDALLHIQALVALRPDDLDAHRLLADCLHKSGDLQGAMDELMTIADICELHGDSDGAIAAYVGVEELELDVVDVNPHIIQAYMQSGRPQQAIDHVVQKAERAAQRGDFKRSAELYESILDLDESRFDLRARYVEIATLGDTTAEVVGSAFEVVDHFLSKNEYGWAIQALEKLIDRSPRNEEALQKLAQAYRAQDRSAEAADTEVRLARLRQEAGEIDAATEFLDRVLNEFPDHPAALQALVEIEATKGNKSGASAALRRLGRSLAGRREFTRAADVYGKVLAHEPAAIDIQEARAEVLESGGMLEDAARTYEALAGLHADAKEPQRAAECLEKVEALGFARPDLTFKLSWLYLECGQVDRVHESCLRASEMLVSHGQHADAVSEVERLCERLPKDTELARCAAELYVRSGNKLAAARRYRQIAEQFLDAGQTGPAEEALDRALNLQPDDVAALDDLAGIYREAGEQGKWVGTLFRAAYVYERRGDLPSAMDTLNKLLIEKPDEVSAVAKLVELAERAHDSARAQQCRRRLAEIHRNAGDYEREARALRDALNASPEDEEVLEMLMACEFARGDESAACSSARRLASLQQKLGRNDKARMTLETALEKAPENADLLRELFDLLRSSGARQDAVNRGLTLVELHVAARKLSEAVTTYNLIAECDPENLELMRRQAAFLIRIERPDEAVEKLFEVATLHHLREEFEQAENCFHEILAIDDGNMRALEELARLYELLGDTVSLAGQLTQLAEAHHARGDLDKAVESLRRILNSSREAVEPRQRIIEYYRDAGRTADTVRELQELSDLHRRLGDEQAAIATEREAVALDSNNPLIRRRLIDALLRDQQTRQAVEELEQLASLYAEAERLDEAIAVYDELLGLAPDDVRGRRQRAELYVRTGQDARALEEFRALSIALADGSIMTEAAGQHAAQVSAVTGNTALQLVKEYDFDHFVVGARNNFAYATALAVARAPAKAYNPLFLYSDVGLGKTHLVNAIANHILSHDAGARVIYTNSEDFTGELIDAIQSNSVNQFRVRYKSVDLLIVDDVQFLAGKERAQEEFFHIFNALFQAKRQIVVTSDRPPKDIAHLESRLLSRFGAGVIVDIAQPDIETRIAILNREVSQSQVDIPPSLVALIAERVDSNVRELKGALNQVLAMRELRGMDITEENVRNILETLYVRS